MQARLEDQEEARALRAAGLSLREISFRLQASLSSVSVWVRSVPRGQATAREESAPALPAIDSHPAVLRHCSRCHRDLPERAFNRHRGGRQWWCRECFRAYFRARGDLHRRQSAVTKERRRQHGLEVLQEHKARHPCRDCGEPDPVVLELDHVGPKRADVSVLVARGASLDLLRSELAQCEVVCVNCHRRRTGKRAGWRRAARQWWKQPPPTGLGRARNMAFAYSHLERTPCVDCGEGDLCVLDFDHVGPKTGTVLKLARDGVGLARLQAEIANCEVRCANCHRRRTLDASARAVRNTVRG